MSKDRAAPFSRKHRRYWIPVTGGMIFIMLINVIVGLLSYPKDSGATHTKIHLNIPPVGTPAGTIWPPTPTTHGDAGPDATTSAAPTTPPR